MPDADDTIRSLRDALQATPHNVPLRKHIAELLLAADRLDEAETEFRLALSYEPSSEELKLALADAFSRQGKHSEAFVVLEALVEAERTTGAAYLAHCQALLRAGEIERAVRQYRRAIDEDPDVADPALAARLGVWGEDGGDGVQEVVDGRIRATSDGGAPGGADVPVERPDCSFADVGGMDELKDEISIKIIQPLAHPELYEAYGKKIGGGLLLYGPPGCGKTHMARATAGEVDASFIAVGIHDVLDMWIGESERKLHELFQQARACAPCVLFFDEVDALGASRSDMRGSAGRQLINQFLAELDGIRSSNEGLLILGATNAPWHLDGAFRRPGRFDQVILVPPPDREARARILEICLEGKPQQDIDLDQIARKTEQFSGADLKALVDATVEDKLRQAVREKKPTPLRTKDLLAARKRQRPTTKEWFATARNYALYSNQGGIYDDILEYLGLK